MRRGILLLSLFSLLTIGFPRGVSAQLGDFDTWEPTHREDVRTWAAKSGLGVGVVHRILTAIGRNQGRDADGEEDMYSIQSIDARSLTKRGQILVPLTGPATGHALAVYVVCARPPYATVWEGTDIFESGSCPSVSSATESLLGEAIASVTAKGWIRVKMPTRRDESTRKTEDETVLLVADYYWTGKTYVLPKVLEFTPYRRNGRDLLGTGPTIVLNCGRSCFLGSSPKHRQKTETPSRSNGSI
jgi:hypothetical protein